MAKYPEQMSAIFEMYQEYAGNTEPVSLEAVARWAVENGHYHPSPKNINKLARDDLAAALRQEKRVDAKGRKYRAKHSWRHDVGGVQLSLWADIDTAPRTFMEKSFAQRRQSIVADCVQVRQDVDHFNDEHSHEEPINMVLDFTDDVAEAEAIRRAGEADEDVA